MRHRVSKYKIKDGCEMSKFRNMFVSLMDHECIKTTLKNAKIIKRFAEPVMTRSKEDSVHNRRLVFAKIGNKDIVSKLFNDIGKRISNRNGGYLRIIRCGFRVSDKAPVAYVLLVDKVDKIVDDSKSKK